MLAQKRVDGGVISGQRAGVRLRQRLARRGAAQLVDQHGLAGRAGAPQCGAQHRRIADRLQEQQDRCGGGVVHQHVDQLAHADIALVADGHQLGKPHAARCAARQQRPQHRSALRNHADRTGLQRVHFQHGVDRQDGAAVHVDHADAVGPQQAHAKRACTRRERLLRSHARFPKFRKTIGKHRHHARAARRALLQRVDHLRAGHHHKRMVDRFGQGRHAGVRGKAHHFAAARIHGQDASRKTVLTHEAQWPGGVLSFIGRGAHQRHHIRCKQRAGQHASRCAASAEPIVGARRVRLLFHFRMAGATRDVVIDSDHESILPENGSNAAAPLNPHAMRASPDRAPGARRAATTHRAGRQP